MPNWGDNIDWDSGAHWSVPAPPINSNHMSIIVTNTSKLPVLDKLAKGQDIITKSTANPNVPGNTAVLTAFSTAQTAREVALETWTAKLNALASFTESATSGDAGKIESAGFAVRAPRTPPQPLPAPTGVVASTNGTPGHTLLDWPPLAGAKSYNVEISPDPITPTSWAFACSCTTSRADVNGAEPGKLYWYRVAGVNGKGQGPWSAFVPRPVM